VSGRTRGRRSCPSACARKTAYATRQDAERAAAMLRDVSMRRSRPYRCPVCKRFFLTEERFGPKGKRSG